MNESDRENLFSTYHRIYMVRFFRFDCKNSTLFGYPIVDVSRLRVLFCSDQASLSITVQCIVLINLFQASTEMVGTIYGECW